jgi:hypothetical protein
MRKHLSRARLPISHPAARLVAIGAVVATIEIATHAGAALPRVPPGTAPIVAAVRGGQPQLAPVATPVVAAGSPRRLRIQAVRVDAPVEPVGLTPQSNLALPAHAEAVGWYAAGVRPGQAGDAVLDGRPDPPRAATAFRHLGRLRPGDLVETDLDDGAALMFRVYRTAAYPASRQPPDLFSWSGPPRMTLVAVAGHRTDQDYGGRLYVEAALLTERDT